MTISWFNVVRLIRVELNLVYTFDNKRTGLREDGVF